MTVIKSRQGKENRAEKLRASGTPEKKAQGGGADSGCSLGRAMQELDGAALQVTRRRDVCGSLRVNAWQEKPRTRA